MTTFAGKKLPPEFRDATKFISRDSIVGTLSASCTLWRTKPIRVKHGDRVVWVDGDAHYQLSAVGNYTAAEVTRWFGTCPETDLELLRVG